jgi:hypothetical protein
MTRPISAFFLPLLLVIAFHSSSVAQVLLELPPMSVQIADRNFNIKEVVDARANTIGVGVISRGPRFAELAMLPGGLAKYLQNYLGQPLPALPKAHSLLLRIDRFGIYTDWEGKYPLARLDADFTFFLLSEKGCQEVFSLQHRLKGPGGWEKERHYGLIISALASSFTALAASGWEHKLDSLPVFAPSQITEIIPPPILAVEKPTIGVYRSFEEFRNNAPFITNLHWKGSFQLNGEAYFIDEMGEEKKLTDKDLYWGFSDGEKLYLIEGKHYVELRRSLRDVHYLGTNRSQTFKKFVKGAVTGGLIGGAIGKGTTPKNGLYIIDMETGTHLYAR